VRSSKSRPAWKEKVWLREHAIADTFEPAAPAHGRAPIAATSRD
jgi:hypothetical protein